MPGDILCTVLGQNLGQGQTIMGQGKLLLVFLVLLLSFFSSQNRILSRKKVHTAKETDYSA